ncbi:MAG: TIR domain-containing protein [Ignavibacteriae bacterium]|nr:TIR domain-containing protein [Ignavibacteriota bacterium]
MSYRNGTYIAFHANNTTNFIRSDMKYFNLLKAWNEKESIDFRFVNSHEKASAVRDTSKKETLIRSLKTRLRNSKNMLLILGNTTRFDTDWIPFEIEYGVDKCGLPIIVAYTNYSNYILKPSLLEYLWPEALKSRIETNTAKTMHIPFKQVPIISSIKDLDAFNMPPYTLTNYTKQWYENNGVMVIDFLFQNY